MSSPSIQRKLLQSALTTHGAFLSEEQFLTWFYEKSKNCSYSVKQIPFSELNDWSFDKTTGNLVHASGKFFTIHGISVKTNYPKVLSWEQPIISQPEIGILGIITKSLDGILHFLMQAKMEPGNVNLVQLSPTLQATKSNYTQVHKGKLPLYFEFFEDRPKGKIIVDQLQSEQGARYLNKRNRNMILLVEDDVEVHENFCWLTLGQLKQLLRYDNLVNMDSRTVLSGIQYVEWAHRSDMYYDEGISSIELFDRQLEGFQRELYLSLIKRDNALHQFEDIISWFTHLKSNCEIQVKSIPLNSIHQWHKNEYEIYHESHHYFSVIAVAVNASTREVPSWTQPLLKHFSYGIVGFLVAPINGILHFLVEARMCPGYRDFIEMGPTVSCGEADYRMQSGTAPSFTEYFYNAEEKYVRFSTILSEEGGRFYHYQNKYMVVEIDSPHRLTVPGNYIWMTYGQLLDFIRHTNYINVEARSLISCLSFL
jgi:oxidase EvaA